MNGQLSLSIKKFLILILGLLLGTFVGIWLLQHNLGWILVILLTVAVVLAIPIALTALSAWLWERDVKKLEAKIPEMVSKVTKQVLEEHYKNK